jgi:hypothetical protein
MRDNQFRFMGLGRVELPTSRLSGVRSNHLSYRPHNNLHRWQYSEFPLVVSVTTYGEPT